MPDVAAIHEVTAAPEVETSSDVSPLTETSSIQDFESIPDVSPISQVSPIPQDYLQPETSSMPDITVNVKVLNEPTNISITPEEPSSVSESKKVSTLERKQIGRFEAELEKMKDVPVRPIVETVIPQANVDAKSMTDKWETKLAEKEEHISRPRESVSSIGSLSDRLSKLDDVTYVDQAVAEPIASIRRVNSGDTNAAPITVPTQRAISPTTGAKLMTNQWEAKLSSSLPRNSAPEVSPLDEKTEKTRSQTLPPSRNTTGSAKNMLGHWEAKMSDQTFQSRRKQRESLSAIGSLKDRRKNFTSNFENLSSDKVDQDEKPVLTSSGSLLEKKKALESTIKRAESAKSTRAVSLSQEDQTSAVTRTRSARQQWEKRVDKRRPDSDSDDDVLYTDGTQDSSSRHKSLLKAQNNPPQRNMTMDSDDIDLENLSESQLRELKLELSLE